MFFSQKIAYIFITTFFISFTFISSPVKAISQNGSVIFYENFANSLDKWRVKLGSWYIDQNTLVSRKYGSVDYPSRIEAGEESWENFRLEVDLNNVDGIDSGIGFRKNNIDNSNYELTIRHGSGEHGAGELSTPQIFLQKVYWNGSYTSIKSSKILGDNRLFPLLHNQWYHIKIEIVGENIKVWVNNNRLFDVNDDNNYIKSGFITLASWTGKLAKIHVLFDNITVTSLTKPPQPFLDLPWDYQSKGLDFNEAALAINSYFDHQYPLLSAGLDLAEPGEAQSSIMTYLGKSSTSLSYSKHDGYDYGRSAKANLGDPVLAAASGLATYINSCSSCGNMVVIDHHNGYQTRYMHLQKQGLISNTPGQNVEVTKGQQIGKVGFSGNVRPAGEPGAHIHFGIFQDKDNDGNFENNVPDGITDPYGWDSPDPDPWENHTFAYLGQDRTGNQSHYLWQSKLNSLYTTLTTSGGNFTNGRYNFTFPPNATAQNLNLSFISTPIVKPDNLLTSIGSTTEILAQDNLGNKISQFSQPYTINVTFNQFDLTNLNTDTISFYSSEDGVSWNKEPTNVNLAARQAQSSISHASFISLMAERLDILPPQTTPSFTGTEGLSNWYRSDVTVTLNARDNEGGSGVDYNAYKINNQDWEKYQDPLILTGEGHYKIEFYSADKDENIEEPQSIEFDIDKTPPEAKIFVDKDDLKLIIEGIDTNQTALSTQKKKFNNTVYTVSDQAGNQTILDIKGIDIPDINNLSINSIQYNNNAPVILPKNGYLIIYDYQSGSPKWVGQKLIIKGETKIFISYNENRDKSYIYLKSGKGLKLRETKNGLVFLQLTTNRGQLNYSY